MGKVYLLENLENDVQIAGFPSPQKYIPIIRYAIEKYVMEDANSIDAIYVEIVYTPISSYFGSKYALRHTLHRTGSAYVRVPYPDVGVYFREYQDHRVDNFFHLLVANTVCLEYNLICRISVEIVKDLDSDILFYKRDHSYLCEL